MTESNEWISVLTSLPIKVGWYKVKAVHGEYEAPMVRDANENLVWLVPDPSIITHWKNK